MKRLLIIVIALLGAVGCTNSPVIETLQEQSVGQGQISCDADRIEIIEHKVNDDGSATWTALCSGRAYNCQRAAGQEDNTINPEAKCVEMESQMPE